MDDGEDDSHYDQTVVSPLHRHHLNVHHDHYDVDHDNDHISNSIATAATTTTTTTTTTITALSFHTHASFFPDMYIINHAKALGNISVEFDMAAQALYFYFSSCVNSVLHECSYCHCDCGCCRCYCYCHRAACVCLCVCLCVRISCPKKCVWIALDGWTEGWK